MIQDRWVARKKELTTKLQFEGLTPIERKELKLMNKCVNFYFEEDSQRLSSEDAKRLEILRRLVAKFKEVDV